MSRYLDTVLNLLAVISLAVCWGAFALTWLAGAIYYEPRAPEERLMMAEFPATIPATASRCPNWCLVCA